MTADPSAVETDTVLVVDDEPHLRSALRQYLRYRGFEVRVAENAAAGLERLRERPVSLMLLDVRMPGLSGMDMVPQALALAPDLAIVMLSAVSDATTAAICMQRGASDYLTKPIELSELGGAIDRALHRRQAQLQDRALSTRVRDEVSRQTRELEIRHRRLERVTTATLEALLNALEAKSEHLRGHSARVSGYAASIAHEMGVADEEVELIRLAGRLHDLGMIGVRENVLEKRGPLTPEELDHVRQHVVIGAQILAPLRHLGGVVEAVASHHEHWDGGGYPDGRAGEDIPLGGRILCAAEVYDALTSPRPYQEPLSPEAAVDRMHKLTGTVLDPEVMDAVSRSVGRRRMLVSTGEDETGSGA